VNVVLTEIKSVFFKILPKSWKKKYLENTIRDVEDRLEFAKKSAIYFEQRLENLKWDLERL
jgi:hypothetical protein